MATSLKRVYWDACAWIALIQKERIYSENGSGRLLEDRYAMCLEVIRAAEKNKIEIVTSSFTLAEVCKNEDLRKDGEDKIAEYFEQDYILLVNVDRIVGEQARHYMMSGISGLKPPDAVHIATAAIANVGEMHTFDGKLLKKNGIFSTADGRKLTICKPEFQKAEAPLLRVIENAERDEDKPETEPEGEGASK